MPEKKARSARRTDRPERALWTPPAAGPIALWHWGIVAFAMLLVIMAYSRVVHFPLVDWDDPTYLKFNTALNALSWNEVALQFRTYVLGNYHPLTMLSLSLDLTMAGGDAGWYHRTNVILHLANVLFLFWFLYRCVGDARFAALAGLLWSVHPMRVESVAWVSARKDLLMLFFGSLALIAYLRYLRTYDLRFLLLSFLGFVASCLSKGMAVALVPVLLLIDLYWERPFKQRRLWLEKAPFVLAALVFGVVAIKAQAAEAALMRIDYGFGQRTVAAGANVLIYLGQQFVPIGLNARYGWPGSNGVLPPWYLLLCATTVGVAVLLGRRARPVERFGLLFMLANLLLVLQVLPFGEAIRADRYTYVAGIGWAVFATSLIDRIGERNTRMRALGLMLVSLYALGAAWATFERTQVWSDPIALWNDILAKNPTSPEFHMDRGITYARIDSLELAEQDFNKAVQLRKKNDFMPYFNRSTFYAENGRYKEALDDLLVMFQAGSTRPELVPNMIYALMKLGKCDDVIANCTAYLKQKPKSPDILNMRAFCLLEKGDPDAAARDLERSSNYREDYAELWFLRGSLALARHDTAAACSNWRTSMKWAFKDREFSAQRDSLLGSLCAGGH